VKRILPLLGLALSACAPMTASADDDEKKAELFTLKDGDRVVLLGNTLIEREQRYGYWELALTARFPDKNVQFRNLGWSGDTVWGQARASFGTPADGFKHLKEHVASLKPTIIIVGYGNNEAFDGEEGLPHFLEGLNKLLDTLSETKARIVLLSPLRQEDLGRPLPDPTEQNKNIRLYREAIRKVAEKRGHHFVDLYRLLADVVEKPPTRWTDNGIHLTAMGYQLASRTLMNALGLAGNPVEVEVDAENKTAVASGANLVADKDNLLRFRLIADSLPLGPYTFRVKGLLAGEYTLFIDGKSAFTAKAKEWAGGLDWYQGPEVAQVEKLRAAIIEKNRLYFHRWRPQNETYLFGFRKYEQGQNAVEVPKFDPLVAKQEEEIAKLRVPVKHTYELKAMQAGGDKE
jgi:lysophospholipase L1-like esterase